MTAKPEVTAADLTPEMILQFWDRSKCGGPDNWNSDAGWSAIAPDDARLAMSSVPVFGVGDLQGDWRNRDAARERIAQAINARRRAP